MLSEVANPGAALWRQAAARRLLVRSGMPPAQLPPACRPHAGAFGWVQHARNRETGEEVAVKFIELGPVGVPAAGATAAAAAYHVPSLCRRHCASCVCPPTLPLICCPPSTPPLPPLLLPLLQRFYQKYVEREIVNHRLLAHPHIVGFKEVFVTQKVGAGGSMES